MASYSAKVYMNKGGLRTIDITARNEIEARVHAGKLGKVVSLKRDFGFNFSPALSAGDRQILFARLSSMLSSRVGTGEALRLLRDTFTGKIQEVSARLLTQVESGDDLAQALFKIGAPDFPTATVAMIQAGSRSGETWKAIQDASGFEHELHVVRTSAGKGMWGAIIGFIIAGVTTVVSTVYIGPEILGSELMQAANQNGSIDVGWITLAGQILGYIMAFFLVIGALMGALAQIGRRILPVQADQLIMKIPYYKDLVLARNNFIVLYGLALLVKSGVRTEEALRLSAENAPKGALRRDLVAATNAVKTGKPWPKVMATLHPTDKAALMSAVDREQIAKTLDTLARQYRELYAQRLGSFVPTLNLIVALFLTLGGGILFGQSVLPILQASQGLLGGP